jgi:hypothetical protein
MLLRCPKTKLPVREAITDSQRTQYGLIFFILACLFLAMADFFDAIIRSTRLEANQKDFGQTTMPYCLSFYILATAYALLGLYTLRCSHY